MRFLVKSMRCAICKKTSEETTLYPGVSGTKMINICENCADDQKVPIIRKPSEYQLSRADKTYSVRERLDKMSRGNRNASDIGTDQAITQRNLARLKMPKPKQSNPEVMDNYYWTISMARRRIKMTTGQLAKKIGVESSVVQEIERGILPKDFAPIFSKLEELFDIKLLRERTPQISFVRKNPAQQKEILEAVAEKVKSGRAEKKAAVIQEKIKNEDIRLSKRENLDNVTLNDLVDRKRAREKHLQQTKQNEMVGDDIDFDEL